MARHALPDPNADFPAWYQEVVKRAGLAEHGLAKGTMIIKPHGYAVWESIQAALDVRFKATGHSNVYFPLFIPQRMLAAEADHVEGFSPELAVVTHGGGSELEEPLIVRPTSEATIWPAYRDWIQSYRDLPLLYNQWCNVVRWEMRTRLFLRTTEFLWQEGHTAHASEEEARHEVLRMLEVYREVAEEVCAMPVLAGRKSEAEKFAGAVVTYTIEAMMRDRRALQCGTSHFLGQNFARAFDVTFLTADGNQDYAWGTSWGMSTRMVGGVVMTHGDERGLRLPPLIAPVQVVVVPIYGSDDDRGRVLQVAAKLRDACAGEGIRAVLDDRDQYRPGYKFSDWELKGVPVRIEVGPRDVDAERAVVVPRTRDHREQVALHEVAASMPALLDDVQGDLLEQARAFREANSHEAADISTLTSGLTEQGGFWTGPWCGDEACERRVTEETRATIRVLPLQRTDPEAPCAVCGRPGAEVATWGRAY